MKKAELRQRTDAIFSETKSALQTMYGNLNKGQKAKLLKVSEVNCLFDIYGVNY